MPMQDINKKGSNPNVDIKSLNQSIEEKKKLKGKIIRK